MNAINRFIEELHENNIYSTHDSLFIKQEWTSDDWLNYINSDKYDGYLICDVHSSKRYKKYCCEIMLGIFEHNDYEHGLFIDSIKNIADNYNIGIQNIYGKWYMIVE